MYELLLCKSRARVDPRAIITHAFFGIKKFLAIPEKYVVLSTWEFDQNNDDKVDMMVESSWSSATDSIVKTRFSQDANFDGNFDFSVILQDNLCKGPIVKAFPAWSVDQK